MGVSQATWGCALRSVSCRGTECQWQEAYIRTCPSLLGLVWGEVYRGQVGKALSDQTELSKFPSVMIDSP